MSAIDPGQAQVLARARARARAQALALAQAQVQALARARALAPAQVLARAPARGRRPCRRHQRAERLTRILNHGFTDAVNLFRAFATFRAVVSEVSPQPMMRVSVLSVRMVWCMVPPVQSVGMATTTGIWPRPGCFTIDTKWSGVAPRPMGRWSGCKRWSGREDLNLRPPAEAGALPGCATPRIGPWVAPQP